MEFQFHKGTIRTSIPFDLSILPANFNSIKVQLERKFTASTYGMIIFQFHKGTIRTTVLSVLKILSLNFNSIKVQLELCLPVASLLLLPNFNSIKVQLELNIVTLQVGNNRISIP